MSRRLRNLLIVLSALLLLGVALRVGLKRRSFASAHSAAPTGLVSQKLVDQFLSLEARENALNKTVWAKEILAEQCGQVFESFWDSLNAATNMLNVATSFPVGELTVGNFASTQRVAHGIELRQSFGAGRPQQSHFYFSAHLTNPALAKRAILEGDLIVDWAPKSPGSESPAVKQIDASRLILKTRQGEPPFKPILVELVTPP